MNILNNFTNPWELNNTVLETNVLKTNVLENHILDDLPLNKIEINNTKSIDLGNLYSRGADKKLKYPKQVRAFELFASSPSGKHWFKHRVHKGFVFKPLFYKKGAFIAKENGFYQKKGIRIKFYITDIGKKLKAEGKTSIAIVAGADGLTRARIEDEKLYVTIYLNSDNTNKSRKIIKIMYTLDTWVHEIMLHGELFENIYINEKRLASNKEAGADHHQTDINKSSYEKEILKVLIYARDTLRISNYTDEMLKTYFKGL